MHGKQDTQEPHTHGPSGHNHSHGDSGATLMRILGMFAHVGDIETWMGDYRQRRIIPASNRLIVGTILVLLVGVVLWHILPKPYTSAAVIIIIAAAAHLAVLVIGGLSLSLF